MSTNKLRGVKLSPLKRSQLLAELDREPQAQSDESELSTRCASRRRLREVLSQQGDVMLYAASIVELLQAAGHLESSNEGSAEAAAAALISDLQAAELLQLVCRNKGDEQLYTTQLMQAALDTQRVLEVQQLALEDVVAKIRSMTFRLSFLLSMPESRAALLRGGLDIAIDEYGEFKQLCQIAVPDLSHEVLYLNMESMEPQLPPEQHWEVVSAAMDLQPEQVQQLTIGFKMYSKQKAAIVADMESYMQQVHKVLWPSAQQAPVDPVAAAAAVEAAVEAAFGGSDSSDGGPLQDWQSWDIGTLEELMQLLRKIDQKVQQLRAVENHLQYSWMNVMSKRQLAVAVVESYPYSCMPIQLCEVATKVVAENQTASAAPGSTAAAPSGEPAAAVAALPATAAAQGTAREEPMDTSATGQEQL